MVKQAPAAKRFIAYIIDWYLASLFGSIPVIILQSVQGKDLIISNSLDGLSLGMAWVAGILALSCHFLYYCIVPYKLKYNGHTGQTLGWRIMRLQLLTLEGTPVSLRSLFLRHMVFFVLLQGYLTTSNIYILTLIKMTFHFDAAAYFQTFYYLTSLISLIIYFIGKRKQLLQDKLSGTMLCESTPAKETAS